MNPIFGLVGRLNASPVLLAPSFDLSSTLRYAMGDPDLQAEMDQHMANVAMSYGGYYSVAGERIPYFVVNGIAVIPVQGMLLNRCGYACSWLTGYDYIMAATQHAMANPDVKGLAFDLASYGGEAQGCFETAAFLYSLRGTKPMQGFINPNSCSACYMIASALDKLTMTPTGLAGSIGVVMMHVDYSKLLDKAGISVTFVYAGDHKVDGNPYEPLPGPVKKEMQAMINNLYDTFTSSVAEYRDMSVEAVKDTQAKVFVAPEALRLGLIDAVAAIPAAMSAFVNELSGSINSEVGMNTENQAAGNASANAAPAQAAATANNAAAAPAVAAPAAAAAPAASAPDAAANERARIQAITGCEEAQGRSQLANHLAFNTGMSADEAKKLLAVSPKEAAAAANAFAAAMDSTKNPEVGANAEDAGKKPEANGADSILSAYSQATGVKIDK